MANRNEIHDEIMARLQSRLLSIKVSRHNEQPGSQARVQAQASSKSPVDGSTRRDYFTKAMREEANNDMNLPLCTPSAGPAYQPNPNPTPTPAPSPGPSSALSAFYARWRLERGRSMPADFKTCDGTHNDAPSSAHPPSQTDFFGSYVIGQDALNHSTFSSTGTTATGGGRAATNLPLPTSLQTPRQASVRTWYQPSLCGKHAKRELKVAQTTFAKSQRERAKAKKAQAEALGVSLKQLSKEDLQQRLADTAARKQKTMERRMRAHIKADMRRLRALGYGMGLTAAEMAARMPLGYEMGLTAAEFAARFPPLGMGQNGHGSHSQEEQGHTSSLDGNASDGEQMEVEQEKPESVQGNVSDDVQMEEGLYKSRQINLFGYGLVEVMVPEKTESLQGNVNEYSDDDQMEE
ncbi:hypothetical protein B0H65DRAFT_570367 [Neurospora tetraspora]|uniref:Uncharacterized protein n=1 Tax=Neurospora tetraspora TaxID=94610 RepID=A0AAE0MSH4_9PEZI|nr:hypothetical protein B0H65DRAFT_570367 [Neurospora tetraspora]